MQNEVIFPLTVGTRVGFYSYKKMKPPLCETLQILKLTVSILLSVTIFFNLLKPLTHRDTPHYSILRFSPEIEAGNSSRHSFHVVTDQ